MLLVGAAKRTITPDLHEQTVFLAGDAPGRRAQRVLDELHARALALRCGRETVVWIALDLLGLPYPYLQQVRQQVAGPGLPGTHVVVTCTRNHAGPDASGDWQRGLLPFRAHRPYARFLCGELVGVVREALAALQPAEAHLACGRVSDVVGGSSRRELAVAQFRAPEGAVIATLVNYPLVPQVLGPQCDAISADFPGALYRALGGDATRGPLALYVCAEAREDPAPAFRARSVREAARVGTALAEAVAGMLGVPPVPIERIRLWQAPLVAGDRPAPGLLRPAASGAAGEVGLLELGPARVALLPGLVAPQVGREVRRMLDVPYRFVAGPANGDLGYLAPQDPGGTSPTGPSTFSTRALDALDRLLLEAQPPVQGRSF